MRRVGAAGVAAVITLVAGCAHFGQPASSVVRVLDYNIHAGKDASAADNLERVSRLREGLTRSSTAGEN